MSQADDPTPPDAILPRRPSRPRRTPDAIEADHAAAAAASADALQQQLDEPRRRRRTPKADRTVCLNSTTLWTTGPLALLSDRARLLWLRLATGEHVTPIPGLVLVDSSTVADRLGWTAAAVEHVAATIPATIMRADWRAGVVWLPDCIAMQPPNNYKNVLGWRATWAALPDTPLADDIHEDLRLHCAGREPSFGIAFAELPPPAPRPVVPASTAQLEVHGTRMILSGISDSPQERRALLAALARQLDVPIVIEAVAEPVEAEPLALAGMEKFVPVPIPASSPSTTGTKRLPTWQRTLDKYRAEIEGVIAYQHERRTAAFVELARRAATPIDLDKCRRRLAELLMEGHTIEEFRTAIDRMYERVGAADTTPERASAAQWWTAEAWATRTFRATLRLDVGAAKPAGISALVKRINAAAPPGAVKLAPLSRDDTRHLEHLLSLAGHDDVSVLATVTDFAAVVKAQELSLSRRTLEPGEVRLLKAWGADIFRVAAWGGVQTAVERHNAGETSTDVFVRVSRALQGEQAIRAVKSG